MKQMKTDTRYGCTSISRMHLRESHKHLQMRCLLVLTHGDKDGKLSWTSAFGQFMDAVHNFSYHASFVVQGRDANKKLQRAIKAAKLRDRLPAMLVSSCAAYNLWQGQGC